MTEPEDASRGARPRHAPSPLSEECILAIDYGSARIGLAIKPRGPTVALPLGILEGLTLNEVSERIRGIIAERRVSLVVIGLPVNPDDSQSRQVKRFARRLRGGVVGVRWRFVDESLSTHAARERAREAGRGSRHAVDDRAAAVILEAYMQDRGGS